MVAAIKGSSILTRIWPYVVFSFKFVGGVVGAAVVALYYNQNKILYIPNPPGVPKKVDDNPLYYRSPSEWSKSGYPRKDLSKGTGIPFEDLRIKTDDGESIHCWLLRQNMDGNSDAPTLVYFHGNAGNMGFRLQNAAAMFAKVGINVMMVDYRGYGSSTGLPSEEGLNKDAEAVLKYLKRHEKLVGSPIVLFGRSLGGAVAVSLAQRYPEDVQAIILENTFLSISTMVDKLLPWPIMFISGDSDELVPPSHMRKLHDLAKKCQFTDFYSVEGGRHNDTWDRAGEKYYERMRDFVSRVFDLYSGKKLRSSGPSSIDNVVDAAEVKAYIPTMTSRFDVD